MDIVHSIQLFSRKSAEHKNHLRFYENCNDNVPGFIKVIQNGVKPFLNETVKKSCFNIDL